MDEYWVGGGQNTLHPTWPSTVKVFWESGWRVDWAPEFMQAFLWFSYGAFLLSSTVKFSTTYSSLGSVSLYTALAQHGVQVSKKDRERAFWVVAATLCTDTIVD